MTQKSITAWLGEIGLEQFANLFSAQLIEVDDLPELTDEDLKDLGLPLGPRRRILKAISGVSESVRESQPSAEAPSPDPPFPASAGERRQLTVLFCDMVGFTEIASRLDPEILQKIVRSYEDACAVCITRYEGYVFQRLGDGIVAFFGYPLAHEGEAERAIHSGLAIIHSLSRLELPEVGHLQVRIGIATGVVVVSSAEKGAVGETMNLASRLQGITPVNGIVVSERVRKLAGGRFLYEDLGEHALKGIAHPTRAFRITGVSQAASRFEAAHSEAPLTPLVGRELEVGLLMERWQLAQDGEGQVIILCGEPGIGKSRILNVLRERLDDRAAQALRFQCSPYYVNSAFYPLTDNFERALHLAREDSADAKLDRLERFMVEELGRPREDVGFVAAMLSIPTDTRYGAPAFTPQKHKDETLRALVDMVEAVARRRRSVMLFEDLHWADPSTLEALDSLIARVHDFPLLMVLTHRPEFKPRWTEHGHVAALNLSKLTRAQSATLISKVTLGKMLPTALMDRITSKTDGVPLFVEELTRAILESGQLTDAGDHYEYTGDPENIAIPATLRDSLMARLDRFAPVKQIAQIGAAIGREFGYELLAAVAPMSQSQIDEGLERLTESGMAFRRGTPPDAHYAFKHALVQDAAYDSLLKSRRQALHGKIARVMEERFPHMRDTEPEVLAHHFSAGAEAEHAIPYWYRAAVRSAARFANAEVIGHVGKAFDLLSTLPEGVQRNRQELSLRLILGPSLIAVKSYIAKEVKENFIAAQTLCETLGDLDNLGAVWLGLHRYYMVSGDVAGGHKGDVAFLERALLAGNKSMLVTANWAVGSSHMWLGQLMQARSPFQNAYYGLSLDEEVTFTRSHVEAPGVTCRDFHAMVETLLGFPDRAVAILDDSQRLADQLEHPFVMVFQQILSGVVYRLRDEPEVMLLRSSAALALCEEHAIPMWVPLASVQRVLALIELGRTEEALRDIDWLELGPGLERIVVFSSYGLVQLAEAMLLLGRIREALEAISKAFEIGDRIGEGWSRSERHRMRAEILLAANVGSVAQAESDLLAALEIARGMDAKWPELQAGNRLARLWQSQGKHKKAHDLLAPIYNWFTEGFDTKDLKEAKALLEQLRA